MQATEKWVYNGVEFKPGDKVRVMRQAEDFQEDGMGSGIDWCNVWVGRDGEHSDMNAMLGHEFTIEEIDEIGVTFEESDSLSFAFPLSSLENLSAEKEAA